MIKIRSISDSDKHFATAIQEYMKRLGNAVQIINYKPSKKDNPNEIILEDTNMIIEKLKGEKLKWSYIILLSKDWKSWSTEQRKETMSQRQNESRDMVFLIGWPYGFDEIELKKHCDLLLSFGAITLPHGLVKLVVVEQLYRCTQIIWGRNYHY